MIGVTRTRLADGRELIYYDEQVRSARPPADTRPLPPATDTPEVRYDRRLDEWVTVASHRQTRTFLPPADQCPLCPSRPGRPTEIPAADYDVVVFENRFPTFVDRAGDGGSPESLSRPARGRCEVVCFTADHEASFASLTPMRVETVMAVWAERTAALLATPGVAHVFPFENRGEEIGVTLTHPHGQIYGYPFVPPRTRQMLAAAVQHRLRTGTDLFDTILGEETGGNRVVIASDHWVAFVPMAARWPLEVHLHPRRRVADLTELEDTERKDFALVYLDLLGRFDRYHGVPVPYIAGWQQAPTGDGRDLIPLHLELFSCRRAPDRIKYLAGSESGMGAFINDVAPETAAARLRSLGA